MKTNTDLQERVQDAIRWEPLLIKTEIGVMADDGIITLTGFIDSYAKKLKAEETVKNVKGVKVVIEKMDVKFGMNNTISDSQIAHEVVNTFAFKIILK